MASTTIERIANRFVVMNRLSDLETINEREYKAIADGLVDGLLPVQLEKSKTGIVFKSNVAGMISLQTFLSTVVSKKMFLNVITQMIRIVKECEKNLLNINNLLFDCEFIFLDPGSQKVTCIFWPIVNNQSQKSMVEFFNDLPFRTVFTKEENHDYVPRYLGFFKNTAFSITNFEKLISSIKDNKPLGPMETDNRNWISTVLGDTASTSFHKEKSKYCPACGNEYGINARFCSSCGSPVSGEESSQIKFLNISEVLGIQVKSSQSETTVLGAEEYEGGTTVLGADTLDEPTFPYLIREKNEETIIVDKPTFRIGKEQKYCDYFISNNNAISRSHADIITKDHRYYVVDHNSTNKTYVDNRVIPVNKEVEIFSGTKLKFANEEFVFYI